METIASILHADLDAFYASVEQLLDPSLRGKPIAVGGGVVLAASYEAKAFGVRGGMPGRRARELCPQLIFVNGHFKDYQRLGDAAIKVVNDFTPLVERISIDEAFADVAGCTHLFGPPAEIARAIRRRVRAELGLPISVGVARTKHLAKIASQVAKTDGLVIVDPDTELEFLHHLPVELMWGVGPVTRARLAEIGVGRQPLRRPARCTPSLYASARATAMRLRPSRSRASTPSCADRPMPQPHRRLHHRLQIRSQARPTNTSAELGRSSQTDLPSIQPIKCRG
jgi:nucleotidyltransferase/DNA polymerase involved in DNA repair